MSWQAAAWLLLGGSTVLMFLGLPVALCLPRDQSGRRRDYSRRRSRPVQFVRNAVQSVTSFALTPIPLFILMGEVLFHTGLAVKVIDGIERLIRHVPGRLAVVAVVAGTVFSRDLGLHHRHDGDARQPDAAVDARARLPSDHRAGPDHGDRRGRHAHPALARSPCCSAAFPASRSPSCWSAASCRA